MQSNQRAAYAQRTRLEERIHRAKLESTIYRILKSESFRNELERILLASEIQEQELLRRDIDELTTFVD